MKNSELRELTEVELNQEITRLRTELFQARVSHAAGQLREQHKLGQLRRGIARALTVYSENFIADDDIEVLAVETEQ